MEQKKILVVNDDQDTLKLLKTHLEAHHYEVIEACDGDEGLEKVHQNEPDLIILDIKMPKIDGYTFVRNLAKDEKIKKIPVIILTAYGAMKDLFTVEGVAGYFSKPFDPKELLERIEACLLAKTRESGL